MREPLPAVIAPERLVARVDAHVLLKFKFSYQVSLSSVKLKAKKKHGIVDICEFVAPKRHDTRCARGSLGSPLLSRVMSLHKSQVRRRICVARHKNWTSETVAFT